MSGTRLISRDRTNELSAVVAIAAAAAGVPAALWLEPVAMGVAATGAALAAFARVTNHEPPSDRKKPTVVVHGRDGRVRAAR